MPPSDHDRLVALETQLLRDDPRFIRRFRAGRPARPREYRRTGAWWGLGLGVVALGTGIALAQGLLIAGGLVLVGMAAQLADPDPARLTHRGFGRR